MNKTISFFLFYIAFLISIYGQSSGDFNMINDGTITITGYRGSEKDIIIPETINGLTVTAIGNRAFQYKQLTSVTIPNGVIYIGWNAFYGNQLTSVTIGNNVTTIGMGAFFGNQLTVVNIPDSVTYIGEDPFGGNRTLTEINVSSGNTAYCSVNGVLYNKTQTTLVTWPVKNTSIEPITIPPSVTTIGARAFSANLLTGINIPDSVTTIEDGAFSVNRLTSVIIPNSVTSIGKGAFSNNQLTSVIIPDSVTLIGESAFFYNQLMSIVIPNTVTIIGPSAFRRNPLISITIGANVELGSTNYYSYYYPSFVLGFDRAYNYDGKPAGTYIRHTIDNDEIWWTKQ